MDKLQRTAERRNYSNSHLKRVSWAAIFGGGVLALATMGVMASLGVASGTLSTEGMENAMRGGEIGVSAGIWWVLSGIVSLFIGGLVTGRLAGLRRRWEGSLHGIVLWGLTTIVTLASTGAVLAGIGDYHRQRGYGPHHAGISSGAPERLPEAVWQNIRREAHDTLRHSARAKLLKAGEGEETVLDSLLIATDELDAAIFKLYESIKAGDPVAKDMQIIDVLSSRTEIAPQEAQELAMRWTNLLRKAWQTATPHRATIANDIGLARSVGSREHYVRPTAAAWFTFGYLILSLLAAGLGALIGAPNHRYRAWAAKQAPTESTSSEDE
jgi:hypothetical protein